MKLPASTVTSPPPKLHLSRPHPTGGGGRGGLYCVTLWKGPVGGALGGKHPGGRGIRRLEGDKELGGAPGSGSVWWRGGGRRSVPERGASGGACGCVSGGRGALEGRGTTQGERQRGERRRGRLRQRRESRGMGRRGRAPCREGRQRERSALEGRGTARGEGRRGAMRSILWGETPPEAASLGERRGVGERDAPRGGASRGEERPGRERHVSAVGALGEAPWGGGEGSPKGEERPGERRALEGGASWRKGTPQGEVRPEGRGTFRGKGRRGGVEGG